MGSGVHSHIGKVLAPYYVRFKTIVVFFILFGVLLMKAFIYKTKIIFWLFLNVSCFINQYFSNKAWLNKYEWRKAIRKKYCREFQLSIPRKNSLPQECLGAWYSNAPYSVIGVFENDLFVCFFMFKF